MGADKRAVHGASDVDLDAIRAIAQGAFDGGKGVLWMGWAGGTAVSEDEHTATLARRCVVVPSSTRPRCERVEHSESQRAEPERASTARLPSGPRGAWSSSVAGSAAHRVHPFFSMVGGRKRLHTEVRAGLLQHSTAVLTGWVPASSSVERMGLTRRPVVVSEPTSRAALAYAELWAEVAGLLAT